MEELVKEQDIFFYKYSWFVYCFNRFFPDAALGL